jgi:rhamnulokinase
MNSSSGREVSVAAVDLGASSGRVMLGHAARDRLALAEVNRFPNGPVAVRGTLHWDILGLYRGILDGIRAAGRRAEHLDGIGIDSWAVDYGLLDESGALLGNPVHYRDARTTGVMEKVVGELGASRIYETTGLQFLPFNTLYQLAAAKGDPQMRAARDMLLIPDLFAYWLTGVRRAEITNASTTQMLDATTRQWSTGLLEGAGIRSTLLPALCEPGTTIGQLTPDVVDAVGLPGSVPVIAVASHDTASAVVGVPAAGDNFAYVSCGTWSLVGLELDKPVLTEASRAANFTNELGIDGTVRYLRNVMGLWLLQESLRTWNDAGLPADLETLLHEAARVPAFSAVVDPDDPSFLTPGDMPARIAEACRRTWQVPPQSQAATVRCILDSLALAYRRAIHAAQELSGREVNVVHVVGGGARNALLCQLTADACGVEVIAGPVEAAALGNVLVQARALGAVPDQRDDMRLLLRNTQALVRYSPMGDKGAWAAAEGRLPAR